jgi:uncharacterized OB-fold protein
MSGASADPLRPRPSSFTAFWWEGLQRHELLLQRCRACERHQFPPLPRCRRCGADSLSVAKAAGTGVVHSWIVAHYAFDPAVEGDLPYVIATVQLDEGPRMYARLEGVDAEAVEAGMPLRIRFADRDGYTVAEFVPIPRG